MNSPEDFPEHWLGHWVTADGRALLIERSGDAIHVTLRAAEGSEPSSAPPADRLPARWIELGQDGRGLRVEVGAGDGLVGLGPTFDLFFVDADDRPATAAAPLTEIRAEPRVTMGLYDDYEDDLGVPWAFPLMPWRPRRAR